MPCSLNSQYYFSPGLAGAAETFTGYELIDHAMTEKEVLPGLGLDGSEDHKLGQNYQGNLTQQRCQNLP